MPVRGSKEDRGIRRTPIDLGCCLLGPRLPWQRQKPARKRLVSHSRELSVKVCNAFQKCVLNYESRTRARNFGNFQNAGSRPATPLSRDSSTTATSGWPTYPTKARHVQLVSWQALQRRPGLTRRTPWRPRRASLRMLLLRQHRLPHSKPHQAKSNRWPRRCKPPLRTHSWKRARILGTTGGGATTEKGSIVSCLAAARSCSILVA